MIYSSPGPRTKNRKYSRSTRRLSGGTMPLTPNQIARSIARPTIRIVRWASAILLLPLCLPAHAHAAQENCIIDFPVYDPFGARLEFNVSRVSPEGNANINVLSAKPTIMTSKGNQVFFSDRRLVGRTLVVLLDGPKGAQISTQTVITACRLRHSLFFGRSDAGPDVNGITVNGRLSGCRFVGDWWVRAVPIFGGHEGWGDYAVDGFVESDGSFTLVLGPLGVRRLLIIGHGKDPIKVVAIDVTQGKMADAGAIDLSKDCPK
jgi:hypothetical protein